MDRNEAFDPLRTAAIVIRMAWGDVQVVSEDVPQLQVFISGSEQDAAGLRAQLTEGELLIEQPAHGLSGVNVLENHWLHVLLRVPRGWKGGVSFSTVSGRLEVCGLSGSDAKLQTVSGALQVHDLTFITATLNTVSGHIRGSRLWGDMLELRSVSGELRANACRADQVKILSMTGDADLDFCEAFGLFSFSSVTGSLRLQVPCENLCVQRRAVTGSMHLWQLTEDAEAPLVTMNTVSGDLEITGGAQE